MRYWNHIMKVAERGDTTPGTLAPLQAANSCEYKAS